MELAVTLSATLTDPAVALPGSRLRARVEHAYRAALYVRDRGSGQRVIVAIVDAGGQPGGILVGGVTDLRGVRGMVMVELSGATAWSPRLPAAARVRFGQAFARVVAGAPWWASRVSALRSALLTGDAPLAEEAALALIGLGIGLTPSGDDFLVGLLAGLEATELPMREGLASAIAPEAPRRTTEFGAAVLAYACRGEFSQRLHDVLIATAAGDAAGLRLAIDRATAYGATSGADTLAGLSCALDVAAGRRLAA